MNSSVKQIYERAHQSLVFFLEMNLEEWLNDREMTMN